MDADLWKSVDSWFAGHLIGADDALEHAQTESQRAGLPPISVSRNQGKLLHLLARTIGASAILEIGTLGGYSSIWMARALAQEGRLVTLEIDPEAARVAKSNFRYANLDHLIELRTGDALSSLRRLAAENPAPFDLVFIDANKEQNPDYFEWSLNLTRPGSLIIIDNVVRAGRVIDTSDIEADIIGVRRVTELIAAEPRVSATVMQTVGEKGYDGLLIALVTS